MHFRHEGIREVVESSSTERLRHEGIEVIDSSDSESEELDQVQDRSPRRIPPPAPVRLGLNMIPSLDVTDLLSASHSWKYTHASMTAQL